MAAVTRSSRRKIFLPLQSKLFRSCRVRHEARNVSAAAAPAADDVYKQTNQDDVLKYKRGTGGRSSFSGNVCTVFGCSGYLGLYATQAIIKSGTQMVLPYREDPVSLRPHKVLGDLGQVIMLPWHILDEGTIRRAIKYSNVVVNVVGKDFENHNWSYRDVFVDWPTRLARICKEMGIKQLIHVSTLNATPYPEDKGIVKGGSKWYKTKYEGEIALRNEFPEAVIFRPSDVYGHGGDRFIRYYSPFYRIFLIGTAKYELYKKGDETEKMPVYVGDVARGIAQAINQPKLVEGKTLDIVGPYRYNMGKLLDFFIACMRRDVDEYDFFAATRYARWNITPVYRMKAWIGDHLNILPYQTPRLIYSEKIEREAMNDMLTPGHLMLEDLGVTNLTNIEIRGFYELRMIRDVGYGAPEDSGILDPVDMEGKYPPRLDVPHVEVGHIIQEKILL